MFSGRALGLFFLSVTSAAWIGASFITQALVARTGKDEQAALEPWLLTLICSSTLMIYLPIGHFARKRARYDGRGARTARCHKPRNRQRKGTSVGTSGDDAWETATGCMLPRRRAAASAAADGVVLDAEDLADEDAADGVDAEAGGGGAGGAHGRPRSNRAGDTATSRVGRSVERQPLLGHPQHHHHPHKHQGQHQHAEAPPNSDASASDLDGGDPAAAAAAAEPDVTTMQIVRAALVVAPVWFAAQLAFTASLEFTSVTSNTVLSSCSSLFVYLGSLAIGQEVGSALRLGCVVAAMAGTTLVALGDSRSDDDGDGQGADPALAGSHPLLGDALTLIAAALYALYTIMMRGMLVKDDGAVMALFFGTIGVLYFSVLAPLAGALALAGASVVHRVTAKALGLALVQGLIDYVAADYAWARAVMLLGPTATSCGLAMQIPAAGILDGILNGSRLSWSDSPASLTQFILGSLLIICGFIGVSLEPRVISNAWKRFTQCGSRRALSDRGAAAGMEATGEAAAAAAAAAGAEQGRSPWVGGERERRLSGGGASGGGGSASGSGGGAGPEGHGAHAVGGLHAVKLPRAGSDAKVVTSSAVGSGNSRSTGPAAKPSGSAPGRSFLRAVGLGGTFGPSSSEASYIPLAKPSASPPQGRGSAGGGRGVLAASQDG